MANLEVLALDTAVPQIRAPGAGDGYSVPRDMTMASGTTLSAQALTAAGNVTLSGGTASGVLYLNASKVATSGSALTFDGTNFATTGTATATKLVPTGNVTAGNGMYLPTTNTLAWSTNGSERMRLDSSGNVGIGTTSPDAKLSVNGVASFGAGTSSLPSVAAFGDLDTGMWFPAANTLAWSTGGSERARITAAGNLLIGATSENTGLQGDTTHVRVGALKYITGPKSSSGSQNFDSAITYNAFQDGQASYKAIVSNSGSDFMPVVYAQRQGAHLFKTTSAATADSAITFTNTFTVGHSGPSAVACIGVGAATAASTGAGITFPATQSASSDANTLDDYEEGTWTMAVTDGTTSTTETAYYTKIGRVVYITGGVNNIESGGAFTGNVYVSGLPFTSANIGDQAVSSFINYTATGTTWNAAVVPNTQQVKFYKVASSGEDFTQLTGTDVGTFTDIYVGGFYNV